MANIGDQGNAWVQTHGDHLRAMESHFFLHRADGNNTHVACRHGSAQAKRFRCDPCADAIIQRARHNQFIREHHASVQKCCRIADVQPSSRSRFVFRTNVHKQLVQLANLWFATSVLQMDGGGANQADDWFADALH